MPSNRRVLFLAPLSKIKIRVATSPADAPCHCHLQRKFQSIDTLAFLISQLPTRLPHKTESNTVFKEFLPPFELDRRWWQWHAPSPYSTALRLSSTGPVPYRRWPGCILQQPYTIRPRALDPPFALPQSLALELANTHFFIPFFSECF